MNVKIFNTIILVIMSLMTSLYSRAYDFESNGIYYNILSEADRTAEVTNFNGTHSYSGNISIPKEVICNSTTYTITGIGNEAFKGCSDLSSVTIPNSIQSIGVEAFSYCIQLPDITIPNSVTNIETKAFYNCTRLKEVSIPSSVSHIGTGAFASCVQLENLLVESSNKYYTSINGVLFNYKASELICCPGGKDGSYTLPSSVNLICSHAFHGCWRITSVNIPASVEVIDSDAFRGCNSLTEIFIPGSVYNIATYALASCNNLNKIIVDSSNETYCSIDGILYDKGALVLMACPGGKESVTIPNSVKAIGVAAFLGCMKLKSVVIQDSVNVIDDYAFEDCSSLTDIIIPNSVYYIGMGAFYNCYFLKNIIIPDSISSIEYSTFEHCANLRSVTIPNSVTNIDSFAFYNCYNLSEIVIPDSITNIGDYAFGYCNSLTTLSLPNSVDTIGFCAYYYCSNLYEITIPISINSIGDYAFEGCDNITTIFCKPTTPPAYFGQFGENGFTEATLYVPTGCRGAYESANPWWYFKSIMEMDFSGVEDSFADEKSEISFSIENGYLTINGIPGNETICVYKMDGELIYSGTQNVIPDLIRGIYIVKVGNTMAKVAI